jgi:hypothetical protein
MAVDPELSRKRAAAARSGWEGLTSDQRRARTANARAKRLANLMDEVDPDRNLSEEQRRALAEALQRVRLAEASLRSVAHSAQPKAVEARPTRRVAVRRREVAL